MCISLNIRYSTQHDPLCIWAYIRVMGEAPVGEEQCTLY